jgi:hypothetical protein
LLDGGAIVLKEIEAGAALENCLRLINQINALAACGRAATELLFYLECAASALEKSAPRAANYH